QRVPASRSFPPLRLARCGAARWPPAAPRRSSVPHGRRGIRHGGAGETIGERRRMDARLLPRPYFFAALTTRRLRPFARRRLRTLRPCLVLIRLRNPCSRLRRMLLGWCVRFTAAAPVRAAGFGAPGAR